MWIEISQRRLTNPDILEIIIPIKLNDNYPVVWKKPDSEYNFIWKLRDFSSKLKDQWNMDQESIIPRGPLLNIQFWKWRLLSLWFLEITSTKKNREIECEIDRNWRLNQNIYLFNLFNNSYSFLVIHHWFQFFPYGWSSPGEHIKHFQTCLTI